ncbi:MAG: hypothetical protein KC657_26330, partial [Myxococcales bacterium]|nr:hypothetical protein [Myxococcales bacterium]
PASAPAPAPADAPTPDAPPRDDVFALCTSPDTVHLTLDPSSPTYAECCPVGPGSTLMCMTHASHQHTPLVVSELLFVDIATGRRSAALGAIAANLGMSRPPRPVVGLRAKTDASGFVLHATSAAACASPRVCAMDRKSEPPPGSPPNCMSPAKLCSATGKYMWEHGFPVKR